MFGPQPTHFNSDEQVQVPGNTGEDTEVQSK